MFLSVIVPVYNAAQVISRCLESIWTQHLPSDEYEVICVDDCSADNSVTVLQEIRKQHMNLRVVSTPANLRAGGARNCGMRLAQGEYILFIDSDDYFHPESLHKVFCYLQNNTDVDILTCNFARELPNAPAEQFVHRYYSEDKLSPAQYIAMNRFVPCGPCQWLFKRILITEHNIYFREHTICEDVDWTHRLILQAKLIQYQPVLLSHYVIEEGTQTARSYANPENVYAYMNAGYALYELRERYAILGHSEYITGIARSYIQQGMKYYLAMYDAVSVKTQNIKKLVPRKLILSGAWRFIRHIPLSYTLFSNLFFPVVRCLLSLKMKYSFRGIKKI